MVKGVAIHRIILT